MGASLSQPATDPPHPTLPSHTPPSQLGPPLPLPPRAKPIFTTLPTVPSSAVTTSSLLPSDNATCAHILLERKLSGKPCMLDKSFGCIGGHGMWVGGGCRGRFLCNGNPTTCGYPGMVLKGRLLRHVCSCAPMYVGGMFMQPGSVPVPQLPAELRSTRLVEAFLGSPRFVPRADKQGSEDMDSEALVATFSFWNTLDALMMQHGASSYQTGYVRELQARRMAQVCPIER